MSQKKVISTLAFIVVVFFTTQHALTADFRDVSKTHPNYDAIQFAQNAGIVSGYPDGTFKPDQKITRSEFIKIVIGHVYKAKKSSIDMCQLANNYYPDVNADAWYVHYLCRATDDHIIGGYPDNRFRPDQPISFVESAKIIAIGMTIVVDISKLHIETDTYNGRIFPQKVSSPWYMEYVNWLAMYKAIPLDIKAFDQNITRGQVSEILYRLSNKLSKDSQTYDLIGNNSWFSITNVCTDPPIRGALATSSSDLVFPAKKEYKHLGYLGELLTAEECGKVRLQEFIGGNLDTFGANSPSVVLESFAEINVKEWLILKGFKSKGLSSNAEEWAFSGGVNIDTLLGLRSFASSIKQFDCNTCYSNRPSR